MGRDLHRPDGADLDRPTSDHSDSDHSDRHAVSDKLPTRMTPFIGAHPNGEARQPPEPLIMAGMSARDTRAPATEQSAPT